MSRKFISVGNGLSNYGNTKQCYLSIGMLFQLLFFNVQARQQLCEMGLLMAGIAWKGKGFSSLTQLLVLLHYIKAMQSRWCVSA